MFCKDPADVTVKDFLISGLNEPGNTNNSLGFSWRNKYVNQVPGMNTLGVSVSRLDYAPGGRESIHWSPRASEIFTVLQGKFYVAFVASTVNNKERLFEAILKPGDGIVFPRGLPHFEVNIGKKHGVALRFNNHENPGIVLLPSSVFHSTPVIKPEYLAKAFLIDEETAKGIQARVAEQDTQFDS
ncbi:hypothetical protein ACFE04_014036 [Oxalis oulophora]